MHELSYHILKKQVDTVTGLVVVVVLGFYVPPTAKVGYWTGKNRFHDLLLFFINWVGRVISLDCQYIIRVAEESCSNCSLLPKSDCLTFYMYSTM